MELTLAVKDLTRCLTALSVGCRAASEFLLLVGADCLGCGKDSRQRLTLDAREPAC